MTVTHVWNGTGLAAGPLDTTKAGTGDNAFTGVTGSPTIVLDGTDRWIELPANQNYARWTFANSRTQGAYRGFWRSPPALPTGSVAIARLKAGATGTVVLSITLSSFGTVRITATGGTQAAQGTAVLAVNTKYRFEWVVNHSDGTATLRIYSATGTLLDTLTAPAGSTFGANHDTVLWGTDSATSAALGAVRWNQLAVSDEATFIGVAPPPPAAGTVNAGQDQTVAAHDLVSLIGSVPAGATNVTWTKTSGPAVTLTGTGANREFEAPASDQNQVYIFTLSATVSGTTQTDTVSITVPKHRYWVMKGGVLVPYWPRARQPRVAATMTATVAEVGADFANVTYSVTPNSDDIVGVKMDKSPQNSTTTRLVVPTDTQPFRQLTPGTQYTVVLTPIRRDGSFVTSASKTVNFTPEGIVTDPTPENPGTSTGYKPLMGIYYSAGGGYGEEVMKTQLGTYTTAAGVVKSKYPDLMSAYVQFGVPAVDPASKDAQGNPTNVPPGAPYANGTWYRDFKTPTFSGWKFDTAGSTQNDEKALADKGIARLVTFSPHSSSIMKWLAEGRAANPAGYDWAASVIDGWITRTKQRYTYNPDVPLFVSVYSEPDVSFQRGQCPDAPIMGKFFSWVYSRFRQNAPGIKTVLWLGGHQATWINTMFTNMTVPPDVIGLDPYVNGGTLRGPKANMNSDLTTLRTGTWSANFTRLQNLHPRGVIEALISEHGVSTAAFTDAQLAKYIEGDGTTGFEGIRQAQADVKVLGSIWFLSDGGPNGDHNFLAGAKGKQVQACAAWARELNKAQPAITTGSTGGGTGTTAPQFITTIGSPSSLGDPDSTGTLKEVSGIVASRKNPGIFWAVNDQGTTAAGANIPPQIFAFSATSGGRVLHTITLTGAQAPASSDQFEELSKCKLPGGAEGLMVGRIGNGNNQFFRVAEPTVAVGQTPAASDVVCDRFSFVANEADHEAFAIDPRTGDLFLLPKTGATGRPRQVPLYRIAASEFPAGGRTGISLGTAVATVRVDVDSTGSGAPTGMDISDDGEEIVVGNYQELHIWHRDPATETVSDSFIDSANGTGVAVATIRKWFPSTGTATLGAESYCFAAGSKPGKIYSMAEGAGGGSTLKETTVSRTAV